MAGPFPTLLLLPLLLLWRFSLCTSQDCSATWIFKDAADIIEDELKQDLVVGQLYNLTCSAACGTHSWEINRDIPSSLPAVDRLSIINEKCNENDGVCEPSTSVLPCDNAIEGEILTSKLSVSFRTPGTYTIQCRSRILFTGINCDAAYTFYSRQRSLTVKALSVEVSPSSIVPTKSSSMLSHSTADRTVETMVETSADSTVETIVETSSQTELSMRWTAAELGTSQSATMAMSCQPSQIPPEKLIFNTPEILLGMILLGVALLSTFTAVMVFLTVCWYKRQHPSKAELSKKKTRTAENDYVDA